MFYFVLEPFDPIPDVLNPRISLEDLFTYILFFDKGSNLNFIGCENLSLKKFKEYIKSKLASLNLGTLDIEIAHIQNIENVSYYNIKSDLNIINPKQIMIIFVKSCVIGKFLIFLIFKFIYYIHS